MHSFFAKRTKARNKAIAALLLMLVVKPRKEYQSRVLFDGLNLGRCGSIIMGLLSPHERKMQSLIRMGRPCFYALVNWLIRFVNLQGLRYITVEEKVLMFLLLIS